MGEVEYEVLKIGGIMLNLETTTYEALNSIIQSRKNTKLEIPAEIAGFKKQIPNVDFSKPKEIPPTPSILDKEGLTEMLLHKSEDLKGKYIKLIVLTYALGGRIFYKELESGNYEAELTW